MEIGDKVRFLSDVGGGVVAGFQGKNMVLVEDEDGFAVPVPLSEVVVIDTSEYNFVKKTVAKPKPKAEAERPAPPPPATRREMPGDGATENPLDRPVTFRPKPEERKDAEALNVFLDFVPANVRELSKTAFECYIVNDCNYFVAFTYLSKENAACKLRAQGVVAPNTKLYIEDVTHAMLNDIERVAVQLVAYKEDKPFVLKPAVSVELRIDTTKFYKLHTFRESLFFDEPTLEFDIVRDDRPARPLVVSARELKQAMAEKETPPKQQPARAEKKADRNTLVEIDLHAHELLETTAGMSAGDIKEYQMKVFRETMDAHLKEKGRRIVFIHGKGEGALRQAIVGELKRHYKSCTYQDASFQHYGFGATMVIIH